MDIEILAVGTELLMGQIINTNAQYISNMLPDSGANVYYHSVVGDNPSRLKDCLDIAFKRCDTVITTGGLGPTEDDLTKEIIASYFNRKMVLDEASLLSIKNFFIKRSRVVPDNVYKQAIMPENCIIIKNTNGTAPGCIIEETTKTIIMLPGPPSEMIPMFNDIVMPYLKTKSDCRIVSRFVKILGIGESMVEEKLLDIIDKQTNPTLATYVKEGEVILRITVKCKKDEDPEPYIKPVLDEVVLRLGNHIYDTNGRTIEEVLVDLLSKTHKKVAFAESCTGGLLGESITEIPGSSEVFLAGVVCYCNESKIKWVGVNENTICKYGAVSRQTALEMAEGIRKSTGADYGISVTGIAGPGGGSDEKPVGLVYIALSGGIEPIVNEFKFTGNRLRIRNLAKLSAFDMLRLELIGETVEDG